MVIFLDTSAIYALSNEDDAHHDTATSLMAALLDSDETLLIHNYVILESVALLSGRGGWPAARKFLATPPPAQVRWIDEALHRKAVEHFLGRRGRFSLVDEVSFLVMREEGVKRVFTFDQDFAREGFVLYRGVR